MDVNRTNEGVRIDDIPTDGVIIPQQDTGINDNEQLHIAEDALEISNNDDFDDQQLQSLFRAKSINVKEWKLGALLELRAKYYVPFEGLCYVSALLDESAEIYGRNIMVIKMFLLL